MSLSDREQRILQQIEQGLLQEDPKFLERANKSTPDGVRSRRFALALVMFVAGLVGLLGVTFHIAYGAIGFVLMFAGVLLGARSLPDVGAVGGDFVGRLRRAMATEDDSQDA